MSYPQKVPAGVYLAVICEVMERQSAEKIRFYFPCIPHLWRHISMHDVRVGEDSFPQQASRMLESRHYGGYKVCSHSWCAPILLDFFKLSFHYILTLIF